MIVTHVWMYIVVFSIVTILFILPKLYNETSEKYQKIRAFFALLTVFAFTLQIITFIFR